MDVIVVSIGALSKNALWGERVGVRASHATTTLVRTTAGEGDRSGRVVLVDPSLPGQILAGRLDERAGMKVEGVTHVFLTNWRPVHRRGLEAFGHARWWMHEREIEAAREALDGAEEAAARQGAEAERLIEQERALLSRVEAAPEELGAGVDLYPLPGYTAGQCGLLIAEATSTTVIAGDAVPTGGHFFAGQVFGDCFDLKAAKESLVEMYEVADVVVPGHDNWFLARRGG
ncbi:MAG TPA: MBL fold metallo-hydrolase [Phycisphaerae bacterium]|nr:MBL fold metallo-hydrolase [Phycisphaerae bacterium]